MVHINLNYTFLILSVLFCRVAGVHAQTDCGPNCSYDFIEKNDTTIELCVSINGYNGKVEFFKLKKHGFYL